MRTANSLTVAQRAKMTVDERPLNEWNGSGKDSMSCELRFRPVCDLVTCVSDMAFAVVWALAFQIPSNLTLIT